MSDSGNQLILNQKAFERLFMTMAQGVMYLDEKGTVLRANPAAEKLLGLTSEELSVGLDNLEHRIKTVYADGTPFPMYQHPAMIALRTGTAVHNVIAGVYHPKEDAYKWILISAEPEFREGALKPYQVFASFTDISNQINSEKELTYHSRLQDLLLKHSKTFINLPLHLLDAAINEALKELGTLIGIDRFAIFEYDFKHERAVNTHEWCAYGIQSQIALLKDVPFGNIRELLQSHLKGEIIHIFDANALPEAHQLKHTLLSLQIKSLVSFPLMDKDQCVGYLSAISILENHHISASEQMVLKFFAEMLVSVKKRINTEIRVVKSEEKYRTLFYDSPDGNLIVQDGIFIECNRAAELILKSDRSRIIGRSPADISPEYQPNGKPSQQYAEEIIRDTIESGRHSFEWVHTHPDGTPVLIQVSLMVIEFEGKTALFTTWRDITQQRQVEETVHKLSSAVEQSPVSIVITDRNARIEYVNPHNVKTTGYSLEELVGKRMSIFKSGETPSEVYKNLWHHITKGEQWRGTLLNKRKNGEVYWESTLISPIKNAKGEITHYITVKEDITDQIRIENEIRDLNQNLEKKIAERTLELEQSNQALDLARSDAERANLAKSDFLSRMSHELRTPMNAILGFAQLLEMSELNTPQKKFVNHILKGGKHLLDLINEVLDISRIEAGRISISIEPVEVNSIVQEIADILNPAAQQKLMVIKSELPIQQPVYAQADRQRLKQVLMNLVNNAIKYNQEGGSVWIKVEEKMNDAAEHPLIRISVIDNGQGIAPENLHKIFTPFERIGAEDTNVEGTGLGLAVVKQLTALMGGNAGVESELGKGSIFWIDLKQTVKELDRVLQNGELLKKDNSESTHQGTILYIEDNTSNIELVDQLLNAKRPGIVLVANMYGKQAVQLAKQHKPKVILLDLNLPDIHGSLVMELLKNDEETKDIPVIIVSADAMSNQHKLMMKAGAKNYITKPIDINAFLKAIDEFIN